MDAETLLKQAVQLLGPLADGAATPEPNRVDVPLPADSLESAVRALVEGGWGYLSAITGLDHPAVPGADPGEGSLEALYHFCAGAAVLTLRVRLSRAAPILPSVCALIPSATLFERELIEMFGITITGTPSTEHFILPEEWPEGVYPLRKDFQGYPEPQTEHPLREAKEAV